MRWLFKTFISSITTFKVIPFAGYTGRTINKSACNLAKIAGGA
jgi:hypothetical protein